MNFRIQAFLNVFKCETTVTSAFEFEDVTDEDRDDLSAYDEELALVPLSIIKKVGS